jgi:ADP-dependent phosphofructokinase/glucokinase
LEKSTSTINVQELIDGLAEDIQELAKNDPDKIKAYEDALGSLKESYSDGKFANYSLKDSQTLKSGLQGRTPQKFFK